MAGIFMKIIAVDDNISILTAIRDMLSPTYEVLTVLSAAELFELLTKVSPDLILIDTDMPDTDGFETIKKLKADTRYHDIPVIFLSEKTDEATDRIGFELGAADYVVKPISAPRLLKSIENQLNISGRDHLLHATNDRLNAIIMNYPGAIFSVDKQNEIITLFNGLYLERIGVTPAFYEGKSLDAAMKNGLQPEIAENVRRTFTDGPQEGISDIKDQKLHIHTMPIFDERGQVFSVVGSVDDLTDMVRLQNDLKNTASRLRAVVKNYPGIICAADKNLNIILFDGLLLPELLDRAWFYEGQTIEGALQRPEYKHIMEKVYRTFTEGVQNWTFEVNNKVFAMTTTPIPSEDGKSVEGVVGRIDNVTEMARLQSDLQAAYKEAKEASIAKSSFLANMSHEIRTPMNAIIGMTNIGKTTTDITRKNYAFDRIDSASNHLLGVINDILDVSKIESGKFELSCDEFDFEKMLQKVADINSFRITEKKQRFNITIDEHIPVTLVGDDQRLTQVITNLLSNAVKFTPEGRTIKLNASLADETAEECLLEISVTDQGIGISADQQSKLFKSYQQAESNIARKFGGTGLGLTISKHIVELMGGRIWIESELGEGAKFIFTAKMKRGTKQTASPIKQQIDAFNIRLIIVDDDKDILDSFTNITSQLEIICDTAANSTEALELISSGTKYDICFIDWDLPDIDGIELARLLRKHAKHPHASVLISAFEWSDLEQYAKAAGVTKFLPKPFFKSTVADCINLCLTSDGKENEALLEDTVTYEGSRILLAEDVEINREIVMSILETTKIKIDCAENGAIAVSMFAEAPDSYDMIFMDVQMPEMDGYEATRRIRAIGTPKAVSVPIIAMTANVFKEDIDRCIEAGMNAHIGKPLVYATLIDSLSKYLRKNNSE